MNFLKIEYGSENYHRECELRDEVLRAPLGLSLWDEDLGGEVDQHHFGLLDGNALVACVIAVARSPDEAKIRQMAVGPAYQGQGCGRRIMLELERHLGEMGFGWFSLHARMTAVGFYEKLGYSRRGAEFTEVGLPHVRMEKRVPS